ncbi:hypothetical protein ACLOJK_011089 [Asimina triloba]
MNLSPTSSPEFSSLSIRLGQSSQAQRTDSQNAPDQRGNSPGTVQDRRSLKPILRAQKAGPANQSGPWVMGGRQARPARQRSCFKYAKNDHLMREQRTTANDWSKKLENFSGFYNGSLPKPLHRRRRLVIIA